MIQASSLPRWATPQPVHPYASWKALLHEKNGNKENKPEAPLTENLQLTRHNSKHVTSIISLNLHKSPTGKGAASINRVTAQGPSSKTTMSC